MVGAEKRITKKTLKGVVRGRRFLPSIDANSAFLSRNVKFCAIIGHKKAHSALRKAHFDANESNSRQILLFLCI